MPAQNKNPKTAIIGQVLTDHEKNAHKALYVVGIGASAGGLAALEAFFQNMPSDSNLAFVVVSHLDPTHSSILPELIQKSTKMAVYPIINGVKVKANCIYVIPPNFNVAIVNGSLRLNQASTDRHSRMSIDYFFHSLAEEQREMAACIILSGMGSDGTLGLRAIKSEMGMVMVQDPDSAQSTSMPKSAINTNLVDYILDPADMPEVLVQYIDNFSNKTVDKLPVIEGNVPAALQKIFLLLRASSGHDFSLYKQNTICRRISRRMNVHHLDNISHYVRYLQETPHEVQILFKELLIGVTNFFRDPDAFKFLEKQVLPNLLADKPNDYCIRVWIPACSSGEEAYSVAIMLRESIERLNIHLNIQVFATDIDDNAIAVARQGRFELSISDDISADRLQRFFIKEENGYLVKKDIREMIVFASQNLIKDPPFTKLDLICCRNLLIYMDAELQKKLFPIFHYSLNPTGILFLGSSESVGSYVDLFSTLDRKWKIYQRKETSLSTTHEVMDFRLSASGQKTPPITRAKVLNATQAYEQILLEEYALPSVIINEKGVILYVYGQTGKYLELPTGTGKVYSVFEMARAGLKVELPSAVRKASVQKSKITYDGLKLQSGSDDDSFNLIVKPLSNQGPEENILMVSFKKHSTVLESGTLKTKTRASKVSLEVVEALEQELDHTKEALQTTIEEMETSNEELKSANEELQSTNEELQSANEELETSKEEQNSLNEELLSVNTELQNKIDELSKTANDMKNLLDGTEIPTVFLDTHLNISRFTTHATKIIKLIASDVGRPVDDITSNLDYDNMTDDATEVLKTLIPRAVEVKAKGGRWYLLKISPYRTIENVIDGVVITFIDISAERKLSEKLQQEIAKRTAIEKTLHRNE